MPTVEHSTLTSTELHEPKGIDSASANEVYVANGAGSGSWEAIFQYGEINTVEADAVSIGSIGTTPITLTFNNDGQAQGVIADALNNRLTLPSDGVYFVSFTISFATTAVGDAGLYEFKVLDDGVATSVHLARQMSGSSDTGSGASAGLINAASGSHITVSVESDDGTGSDDINITNAQLLIFKVS